MAKLKAHGKELLRMSATNSPDDPEKFGKTTLVFMEDHKVLGKDQFKHMNTLTENYELTSGAWKLRGRWGGFGPHERNVLETRLVCGGVEFLSRDECLKLLETLSGPQKPENECATTAYSKPKRR